MNTKTVKFLIAAILSISIALLTMPITLAAPVGGECGRNATWTFNESTGELKIEGSGELDKFSYIDSSYKVDSPWVEILNSIKTITVSKGITNIPAGSFAQAVNLTEAVIPSTLNRISEATFYGCSSLKEITIPNNINEIGYHAFEECTSLESIIIPDSVTYIGESAFEGCTSLKNIKLPEQPIDFHQDIFRDCSSLKNITIPEGCTYINAHMFQGCKSLKNISIPASVTCMYLNSFWSCNNLKNIYYSGSESDWNNIEIIDADSADTKNYPSLTEGYKNATVHYNSDVDAGTLSENEVSAENVDREVDEEANGNSTLTIILIATVIVLVALAGIVIAVVIKKKR